MKGASSEGSVPHKHVLIGKKEHVRQFVGPQLNQTQLPLLPCSGLLDWNVSQYFPCHSTPLRSSLSGLLTFCRLLTDNVRISSILPCQVNQCAVMGFQFTFNWLLWSPFPLVVIDLLGMSCLSLIFTPQKMWILKHTADWICLQGSLIVADFFFSPPQVIDVALLSKLSGLLCLFNSVSVRRLSCSHSVLFKWEDVSGLLVCAPTVVISWDELHAFHSTEG